MKNVRGKIFVMSAPSGCGKTTLGNRLLAEIPGLCDSVSITTRPPRPGEKNGADYFFVSKKRFESAVRRGELLEYEENFGRLYGTPKKFLERALGKGKNVLLSIDVKGAMKIRRAYPGRSVLIFVVPPSIKELKRRLSMRKSDTKGAIARRIALAKKEMSYKHTYDYRVVNDKLTGAYRKLKRIIVSETGR